MHRRIDKERAVQAAVLYLTLFLFWFADYMGARPLVVSVFTLAAFGVLRAAVWLWRKERFPFPLMAVLAAYIIWALAFPVWESAAVVASAAAGPFAFDLNLWWNSPWFKYGGLWGLTALMFYLLYRYFMKPMSRFV